MNTALLDAAFRLVSHSFIVEASRIHELTRESVISELRREFPHEDVEVLKRAYATAQQLEEAAIQLADLERGPKNDHSGPTLNEHVLEARCPGFSEESYRVAIGDGMMATRK